MSSSAVAKAAAKVAAHASSSAGPKRRISGLQKDVFSLYRNILREAVKKDRLPYRATDVNNKNDAPVPSFLSLLLDNSYNTTSTRTTTPSLSATKTTTTTTSYARSEFRRQSKLVKRSNFQGIEYMIRKGQKHLKLIRMPGVTDVGGTQKSNINK